MQIQVPRRFRCVLNSLKRAVGQLFRMALKVSLSLSYFALFRRPKHNTVAQLLLLTGPVSFSIAFLFSVGNPSACVERPTSAFIPLFVLGYMGVSLNPEAVCIEWNSLPAFRMASMSLYS